MTNYGGRLRLVAIERHSQDLRKIFKYFQINQSGLKRLRKELPSIILMHFSFKIDDFPNRTNEYVYIHIHLCIKQT